MPWYLVRAQGIDEAQALALAAAFGSLTGVNATAANVTTAMAEEATLTLIDAVENGDDATLADVAAAVARANAEAEAAAAAAAGAKNVDAIGTVVVKFESPPAPDPLRVSPYYAGDASVDSSAAPGTLYYEKTAIEASNAVDAIDRRVNNDAVVSGAAGAIGAAAASSSFLYSLFRDPSVGPYLLQTWGYLNGLLSPAGGGRP
eukprot:31355-Pelagococcus_subviridis.AAC.11